MGSKQYNIAGALELQTTTRDDGYTAPRAKRPEATYVGYDWKLYVDVVIFDPNNFEATASRFYAKIPSARLEVCCPILKTFCLSNQCGITPLSNST